MDGPLEVRGKLIALKNIYSQFTFCNLSTQWSSCHEHYTKFDTKKCPIFSFSEKKYVIVLLSISDAKKNLVILLCTLLFLFMFFSSTVLCAAVILWLPHSVTYQNILTVCPEQKLKSKKPEKYYNSMKVNKT